MGQQISNFRRIVRSFAPKEPGRVVFAGVMFTCGVVQSLGYIFLLLYTISQSNVLNMKIAILVISVIAVVVALIVSFVENQAKGMLNILPPVQEVLYFVGAAIALAWGPASAVQNQEKELNAQSTEKTFEAIQ
jgi:cytochrome c biogenesis protein CcdA